MKRPYMVPLKSGASKQFVNKPSMVLLFVLPFLITLLSSGILTGCSPRKNINSKVELTISAAASLNEALTEIKLAYESEYPNVDLLLNFAGSGSLAQQIEQGADVDLFLSASPKYTEALIDKGLSDVTTLTPLLKNEIVLVTNVSSNIDEIDFNDLGSGAYDTIGIGEPGSVPAGQYADEIINYLEVSDTVYAHAIFAKDVKEVLSWVETNNVDLGIVYKTDAINSSAIRILASAPENSHSVILYPAIIIKDSKHHDQTAAFLEFLTEEKAMTIFEKYGFSSAK